MHGLKARIILDKLKNNTIDINDFLLGIEGKFYGRSKRQIPYDKINQIIKINDGIPNFNNLDTIENEGLYLLIECLKNINRNVIILDEIYKGNMLMVTEMKNNEDYIKSRKYFIPLKRTRLIFNPKDTLKKKNTLKKNDISFCNNVVYLNKENMTYINPYNKDAFNLWSSKNIDRYKWDISKDFSEKIDKINSEPIQIFINNKLSKYIKYDNNDIHDDKFNKELQEQMLTVNEPKEGGRPHLYYHLFLRPTSKDNINTYIEYLVSQYNAWASITYKGDTTYFSHSEIIKQLADYLNGAVWFYEFPDTDISYETIDSINDNIKAIQTTLIGDGDKKDTVSDEKPPESPSDEPDLDNPESDDEGKPEQPTFNAEQQKKIAEKV